MTKTTKTLLTLGISGLALGMAIDSGLVDVTNASALCVLLPLGAVFFGMFLLSKVLEKETAAFDQERRVALAAAEAASFTRPPLRAVERKAAGVQEHALQFRQSHIT